MDKSQLWLTVEHTIGGCGGHFQTRANMMLDFPERVICPSCPSQHSQEKIAAIKKLGKALTDFMVTKNELEEKFDFKVLDLKF